jgi:hypothetical protein
MNALKPVLHRTPFRPAPFDATIPVCGPKVNIRWSGIANTIVHLKSLRFSPNLHRAGPDKELEGIDLVDERRNDRAKRLLMRFAEKPTESIVGASHGWAQTMAAYRFVTWVSITLYHKPLYAAPIHSLSQSALLY